MWQTSRHQIVGREEEQSWPADTAGSALLIYKAAHMRQEIIAASLMIVLAGLSAPTATAVGQEGRLSPATQASQDTSNVQTEPLLRGMDAVPKEQPAQLKGPEDSADQVNGQNNSANKEDTGTQGAPGAEAMMTRDFLLVTPSSKSAKPPEPLKAFVGASLTLKVERTDITLDGLRGIKVAVVNDTTRPLVVDGEKAQISVGGKNYQSAPVNVVQQSVRPNRTAATLIASVFTKGIPAALTVGLVPTVKDAATMRKPVRQRYGPDESRRVAEASRFGTRILWPKQQTEGIVYIETTDSLTGASLEMPVHTLFDAPDSASLKTKP